jgi:cytochrome c6
VRPRFISAALALLLVTLGLAIAAGCGEDGTEKPPSEAMLRTGAQVFARGGCGTCHALAAADARGTTGPDLDVRRPSRDEIARQVKAGGGGMPAFDQRLDEAEIEAVAAYVAHVAGRSGVSGNGQ